MYLRVEQLIGKNEPRLKDENSGRPSMIRERIPSVAKKGKLISTMEGTG